MAGLYCAAMSTPSVYRFAGCEVDAALRHVCCHGVVAEPQPKALDLLLYLIAHRERVVDKDELLAKIWPGVVVSDSALTQALRKARAMVGDDGERQAVIRTVQRRGFRFVADLEEARPSASKAPAANGVAANDAAATTVAGRASPMLRRESGCAAWLQGCSTRGFQRSAPW